MATKVSRELTCEACVFADMSTTFNPQTCECRRYAPRVLHGSGTGWSNDKFPTMNITDWCGEQREDLDLTCRKDWNK